MTKPISPDDVVDKKLERIPPEVIQSFNELIAERWDGVRATFTQDAVFSRILQRLVTDRSTLFERHWLDVEDIYREQGWVVGYDKPAYCESYPAFFTFSKARRS